jgi:hypothetical protein
MEKLRVLCAPAAPLTIINGWEENLYRKSAGSAGYSD